MKDIKNFLTEWLEPVKTWWKNQSKVRHAKKQTSLELYDHKYKWGDDFYHNPRKLNQAISLHRNPHPILKNYDPEILSRFGFVDDNRYRKLTEMEKTAFLFDASRQQILLFERLVDNLPETPEGIRIYIAQMVNFTELTVSIEERSKKKKKGETKIDSENWVPDFDINTERLNNKMMNIWKIAVKSFTEFDYDGLEKLCGDVNRHYPYFRNIGGLADISGKYKKGDILSLDIAEFRANYLSESELKSIINNPESFSTTDLKQHYDQFTRCTEIIERWVLYAESRLALKKLYMTTLCNTRNVFLAKLAFLNKKNEVSEEVGFIGNCYAEINEKYNEYYTGLEGVEEESENSQTGATVLELTQPNSSDTTAKVTAAHIGK